MARNETEQWHMLVVSRLDPIHGIATVSMDGHVIHSYGNESRGSGVGQMNEPRCIAVDKDGYILVPGEYNHRMQGLIVNPMMTDSRHLPLPVNTSLGYQMHSVWTSHVVGCMSENGVARTECWYSTTSLNKCWSTRQLTMTQSSLIVCYTKQIMNAIPF